MRVVLIGHTYVLEANRGKLRHLVRQCEGFLFIAPDCWPEKDFGLRLFDPTTNLQGKALRVYSGGHVRRFRFHGPSLRKAVGAFSPDIIHVEAEAGSLVALQVSRIARPPGARLTQFCWENIPLRPGFRKFLAALDFRGVDHLFCGSEGARETARQDGFRGPTTVLPQLGVDQKALENVEARTVFSGDAFTLGVVARLDRKKAVRDVIEALARPDCGDARLVVVGDGPQRGRLEEIAKRLRVLERVRFLGAVGHDEVGAIIKGIDCLVLASRDVPGWKEQFGHVLVEAMAVSIPVIGSDCGAIPEVIGDAGLLFPQGDVDALADRIALLLKNPEKGELLGRAGKARVREMFTDEVVAEKMLAVWHGLGKRP